MPIPSYILPSAPAYTEDSVYALIPTPSTPIYTPDAISFTRGSDATRTASNGLIQKSPVNLIQQSESFDNGVWTKVASSVTLNATIAPNGTLTADSLIENTATSAHEMVQTFNTISGNVYTYSMYVKANGRNLIKITLANQFGVNSLSYYDLVNGTTYGVGATATASIQSVGNGWYRCVITSTATSTGTAIPYLTLIISSTTSNYTGDGISGLFIWGAQLVEGSQPLTYFPTTDRLNVPRIDFSQGSCPALLLEPQRTNLALYSDQLSDASWGKIFSSVTANSTTSPDGNTTADTFTADGSNNQHYVVGSTSGTITSGSSYTYTIYAKKNTNNFIQLWISNTFGGMFANFDLNNGVVGTLGTGGTGSNPTSSITSVGNGWYRCSMTFVPTTTGVVGLLVAMTSSASAVRAEANTLSTSVFLWGSQLELGSYATTYIPTTTTSVTRLADACFKTGISSLIGQTEGVVYLDMYFTQQTSAGFRGFFSLEGNITNQFSGINPQTTNNGNDINYAGTSYNLTTGRHKIACTYSQTNNQRKLFVDGVLRSTSTHTNFLATIDRIGVGCRINSFSGFDGDRPLSTGSGIIALALYNTLLTDAQCVSMTT
jgi:hypothetical protein